MYIQGAYIIRIGQENSMETCRINVLSVKCSYLDSITDLQSGTIIVFIHVGE